MGQDSLQSRVNVYREKVVGQNQISADQLLKDYPVFHNMEGVFISKPGSYQVGEGDQAHSMEGSVAILGERVFVLGSSVTDRPPFNIETDMLVAQQIAQAVKASQDRADIINKAFDMGNGNMVSIVQETIATSDPSSDVNLLLASAVASQ